MSEESVDLYTSLVIEHFEHPRNAGRFAPADDVIESSAGVLAQGTVFNLSARVAPDVLIEVRFEAFGCPHCIAAGSWLTGRLTGANFEELANWSWREAAQALQVPAEKRGHLLILEDAVRRLADAWRRRA